MYTLIILGVLCLTQFIYLWMKWQDIQDWKALGDMVVNETVKAGKGVNISKKVSIPMGRVAKFGSALIKLFGSFKRFLWIPAIILFVIDLVISILLGIFVTVIINLVGLIIN